MTAPGLDLESVTQDPEPMHALRRGPRPALASPGRLRPWRIERLEPHRW